MRLVLLGGRGHDRDMGGAAAFNLENHMSVSTTLASSGAIPAVAGRVLVLGANGRFGRAAVRAFAAAGWQVTAQTRRAPLDAWPLGVIGLQAELPLTPLPADASVAALRAELPAALLAAAAQADVIVHALNPDYTRWDTLLAPLTARVLALADGSEALLMLPGNVYNFGTELPAVLREDTPFVANAPRARLRIELEAALAEAARQGRVRSVVIRAGDFLAPAGGGDTMLELAIARQLGRGRISLMGQADLPHAWAWLPDLAEVFVRVAARRAELPDPHTVFHVEGLTLTGAQIASALQAAVGRPLKVGAFPWWLLRLAAPVAPMLRALWQMRYLWQRPHQLDERRLQQFLGGSVPHTPLFDVMRSALAEPTPQGQARQPTPHAGRA
jgi:nucleoside-diphosphate-sugar epimerase